MTGPVVLVDDDESLRAAMAQMLGLAGFEIRALPAAEAALAAVDAECGGPMVRDIRMPRVSGLRLFDRVKAIHPGLPVILITGHGNIELAVAALKDGLYDFIPKPFDAARLAGAVRRAAEKRRLVIASGSPSAAARMRRSRSNLPCTCGPRGSLVGS